MCVNILYTHTKKWIYITVYYINLYVDVMFCKEKAIVLHPIYANSCSSFVFKPRTLLEYNFQFYRILHQVVLTMKKKRKDLIWDLKSFLFFIFYLPHFLLARCDVNWILSSFKLIYFTLVCVYMCESKGWRILFILKFHDWINNYVRRTLFFC